VFVVLIVSVILSCGTDVVTLFTQSQRTCWQEGCCNLLHLQ